MVTATHQQESTEVASPPAGSLELHSAGESELSTDVLDVPAGSADEDVVAAPAAPAEPAVSVDLAVQIDVLGDRIVGLEQAMAAHRDGVAAAVADAADRSAAAHIRWQAVEATTAAFDTRLATAVAASQDDRADLAAMRDEVDGLRDGVRRLTEGAALDIAREVERHTTAALIDGQQRLHQASVAMAGLAQSLAEAARSVPDELTAESAGALLDSFAVDVDLVLARLGHEPLGVAEGQPFDPRRHRALRRVPTDDPQADRMVARVLRDGYRTPSTDRVLLFADVEVHRHTPAEATTSKEAAHR